MDENGPAWSLVDEDRVVAQGGYYLDLASREWRAWCLTSDATSLVCRQFLRACALVLDVGIRIDGIRRFVVYVPAGYQKGFALARFFGFEATHRFGDALRLELEADRWV